MRSWSLLHVAAAAKPIAVIPATRAETHGLAAAAVDAAVAEPTVLRLHDRPLA